MGTPKTFVEKVTSPPTLELLELFRDNSYDAAIEQLGAWGLPRDLAHGAWSDFKVLLGPWDSIRFDAAPMVFIHHGEGDDNAPIESVRDLASKLPKSEIRISPYASHAGLAEDDSCTEMAKIFREVSGAER
ncbi:alpha/beta fold hydrolase [Marilutibacter alkalisoli]|uniref:Alpha/beta hydrolase n=1 Tax=Marilutibacter alkalisoli TaxID=2591633 RepID=A0A514BTU1_9GAMM|nr:hypothetical protein [Lysobacter alkalisoli]QDH70757.1 hypothetical protein FKV23_12195 [Lysobacter alkalisoli]